MLLIGRKIILDDLGIYEVILESLRQSRFGNTRHYRDILSDVISHIGHVIPLLQQIIATLQIVGKQVYMAVPSIFTVKFVPESAIQSRKSGLIGLGDIQVK